MDWLNLLRKAVQIEGSQAAVARKINCSTATISLVLSGNYPGDTGAIRDRVLAAYGGKTVENRKIPDGYMENAVGNLVPLENVNDEDLARDEFVKEVITKARRISESVKAFKQRLGDDMQAFLDLSAEKYDVTLGGPRGNVTLTSFDGRFQILRAVSDQIDFDERLQFAKALIDECLREWSKDAQANLRVLIDDAFQVDKKGRINAKRILGLRKHKIEHEKWQRAMAAISDAITITGSRIYYRFYERDETGNYKLIVLDFSGA